MQLTQICKRRRWQNSKHEHETKPLKSAVEENKNKKEGKKQIYKQKEMKMVNCVLGH